MSEHSPPAPGPEHEGLQPFIGCFKAKVSIWMGPGDPMVATGVMTNSWVLDGLYMRQVYEGDPVEGPFPAFKGQGYWGFNSALARYEGFWIDNASSTMQMETGTLGECGRQWTMRSEFTHPQTKATIARRSLITLVDDDHHTMETYTAFTENEEMKTMAIEYVRDKG